MPGVSKNGARRVIKVKNKEKVVKEQELSNKVQNDNFNSLANRISRGEIYRIDDFIYSEEGLYYQSIDKKTGEIRNIKISDGVYIDEVVHNIDDKDTYIKLIYNFNNKYIVIKCPMSQLLPNELMKLIDKGVDIPYDYRKLISRFLNSQRTDALHKNTYRNVGWYNSINNKGEVLFRHNSIFTNNPVEFGICDEELSEYNLKPIGNLESWIAMFNTYVQGNFQAEALICIGVSSILVGYLARITKDIDSLIIHLCGNSTQGKTTGAMLAVSLIGNPSSKGKGLLKTWNGTTNAIINSLAGNYGIPVIFDELSMSKEKELTSEIYTIATGKDKARLTDSIVQRKQGDWATTVISTGEQSLLERTNRNAGLSIRAIEFSNIQWTTSAQNSEVIKETCLNNYGIGVEKIVNCINELGESRVIELVNKWRDKLDEGIQNSKFKHRMSSKLAIILAIGEIINNSIKINLNLDEIFKFLVENEDKNMLERDIGMNAFNKVVQVIIENKCCFKINNIPLQNSICWGNISLKADYYEVTILKNILDKNIRQLGYGDPKIVIKEWKSNNLLDCEGDRNTKRVRVFQDNELELRKVSLEQDKLPNKLEDTTYILKIPKEYLEDFLMTK